VPNNTFRRYYGKGGRGLETKVRVVSDGEEGMRSMVGRWFNANEQHVLGLVSHRKAVRGLSEKGSSISLISKISNTDCQVTGST
jgi:hypothetical protein